MVRALSGVVVRHLQLEGDNHNLMRLDGVQLSDIGLNIFLAGLQEGFEKALFLFVGGEGSDPSVGGILRGGNLEVEYSWVRLARLKLGGWQLWLCSTKFGAAQCWLRSK